MQIDGGTLPAPPLHELLAAGLDAHPDEAALVSAQRRLSWLELEDASLRLAGAYRELGLEPGDRIASLMPNRIALVVHCLACFRAGLVLTPLNYRYTHREIDHTLEVSGAAAIVAHAEREEDLAASELAAALSLGAIVYGDSSREEAGAGGWAVHPARRGRAPLQRRPDRPLPRADRLQGAGGGRRPRRDAAQPDRQDRPRRAEEDGRGPPPPQGLG